MFRRYKENDIRNIINLEEKVLHSSLGYDYYHTDLNNNLAYHYVLENDVFIGFISSIFDGEVAEILNLGIDPVYQGLGYGSSLMENYITSIKELGCYSIVLEVRSSNEKAISLYKKFGFKTIRIRKNYYSDGEDELFMQKIIDQKMFFGLYFYKYLLYNKYNFLKGDVINGRN